MKYQRFEKEFNNFCSLVQSRVRFEVLQEEGEKKMFLRQINSWKIELTENYIEGAGFCQEFTLSELNNIVSILAKSTFRFKSEIRNFLLSEIHRIQKDNNQKLFLTGTIT